MGLAAIDCIQRGCTSLRANWELVLVQLLQSLLVTALVVVGLLPPLAVLGLSAGDAWRQLQSGDPTAAQGVAEALLAAVGASGPALLAAGAATMLVWLLAFLVACYLQGGIYGVLATADRQAPLGELRRPAWFRTFSWRDVQGWGRRNLWRFFLLWNLVLAVAGFWLLASAAWLVAAALGGERWGAGAAAGIGCGGALPLLFGWVTTALWASLSLAALADGGLGVLAAARRGAAVLGRRLGGVLLVFLLFVVVAFALTLVFAPLSVAFDLVLREQLMANLAASAVLGLAQSLLSALVGIALVASLIALVRSEGAPEREVA